MSDTSPWMAIAEHLRALEAHLRDVLGHFRKLPDIIEREHKAGRAGQIAGLEAGMKEKTAAAEAIAAASDLAERCCVDTQRSLDALVHLPTANVARASNVSELLRLVRQAFTHPNNQAPNSKAIGRSLGELQRFVADIDAIRKEAIPRLETNRLVLEHLLVAQQQSFAFWQRVFQEREAPYDAMGQQKAPQQGSVLNLMA